MASARTGPFHKVVIGLAGLWLGLTLLKFGNPVIFEGLLPPPSNLNEIIHFGWPAEWGWIGSICLGVAALALIRLPRGVPMWLLLAPAVWLCWQLVASFDSVNPAVSRLTVIHFAATVGWFCFGLMACHSVRSSKVMWVGLALGLCLVISSGFDQQFGGLDSQRAYAEKFLRGELPPDEQAAAEAQGFRRVLESPLGRHKLMSPRIYGTLFYPNTLAGVLILLTPGVLAAVHLGFREASGVTRNMLIGLIGGGAALCLVWSGSKAGWLIGMMMTGWLLFMSAAIPAKWRRWVLVVVIISGLGGLVVRDLDYFKRGARSVGARADYWQAAAAAFVDNPLTGTGPGTFADTYRERKPDAAEMARLAHNDFIQQASDSGAIGFFAYALWVVGSMCWLFIHSRNTDRLFLMTWLGLAGWAMHSLGEFGLYIPAVAWPAFFLLGLLLRDAANPIDTPERSG
ncbi:MAG TPA: hypothetical protein DCY13_09820 [Verrucomicrobiales bacterium]|nr:hypothetical protein [Verrucomicrobiales bacterium]